MRRVYFIFLAALMAASCTQELGNPPKDHPYFPSALIQNDKTLYVFSSNFDRRYDRGSVMSVDLEKVDLALSQGQDPIVTDIVVSSAYIPNFVDGVQLSKRGDRIFYVSRDDRSLRTIPVDLAGNLDCPGRAELLGQDCYSQPAAALLVQNDPYFLRLFEPNNLDVSGGAIGYLLEPRSQGPTESGSFLLPTNFEFQRFTWNTQSSTAQLTDDIPFGQVLQKKLSPSFSINSVQINSLIGTLVDLGSDLYMTLVHTAPQPRVFLVRMPLSELQAGVPTGLTLATFDLSEHVKASSLGVMALRHKDVNIEIFLTSDSPGSVIKLSMPDSGNVDVNGKLLLTKKAESFACDMPTDAKLSPQDKFLIVTCSDGKVLAYNPDTLLPLYRDPDAGPVFGRGTTRVYFDSRFINEPFRFYTTNFSDGSIGLFELGGTGPALVARKAHIFQPAPQNRLGGTK